MFKRIEMIAYFNKDGDIRPIRFKYDDDVIKIDRINYINRFMHTGVLTFVYNCTTYGENSKKIYDLRYNRDDNSWFFLKGY